MISESNREPLGRHRRRADGGAFAPSVRVLPPSEKHSLRRDKAGRIKCNSKYPARDLKRTVTEDRQECSEAGDAALGELNHAGHTQGYYFCLQAPKEEPK